VKILVNNSGSSSLKYTLFSMKDEIVLFSGEIERIGLEESRHIYIGGDGRKHVKSGEANDHGAAFDEMLSTLVNEGPIENFSDIYAVAHRVAHGGSYDTAVRIDSKVMDQIRLMTPLLPLHHPAMIKGIEECQQRMPEAIHVAVFDTSFHSTIPIEAALYGLPYRYYSESGYRRIGFHGNSHAYVAAKAAEFLDWPLQELRIITCHLGSGASLCAIDGGRSIDTTLGMTALSGLIMGTRCGDVDPGLIPVIMDQDKLSPDDMINMLYQESGLKGISGVSQDLRDVEDAAREGNQRAQLAIKAFCYQIRRLIGSMLMALGGCDVLVFTGGIGTNSSMVRAKAVEGARRLGFVIDQDKNVEAKPSEQSPVVDLSADQSRAKILAIQTFEELMMARQCYEVVTNPA
jgi:acetate kinase